MIVIGVNGKRHHGKDTIGVFLKPLGFERYALGDRLRELLYKTNPCIGINRKTFQPIFLKNMVDSMGWEKVKQTPEVIRLQQNLGTSAREVVGEDVWHRATETKMNGELPTKVAITDIRFPSDAEWVRSIGGQMWRVNRPGYVDPAGEEIAGHISETALDEWPHFDAIIQNEGDLVDLKEKVHQLLDLVDKGEWITGGTL